MAKSDMFEKKKKTQHTHTHTHTQVQRGPGWDPRFAQKFFKAFSTQFSEGLNMILFFMLVVIDSCLIDMVEVCFVCSIKIIKHVNFHINFDRLFITVL